jgi:hypothetical protein
MGGPTRRVCATYLTSPAASPKHQARTVTPGGGIHFRCAGDQHSFPRPAEFGGRSGTCPERSQRSSDITAHAHASFRTERADFFFRFAPAKGSACGCEKSLCAFPTRTPPPPLSSAFSASRMVLRDRTERGICFLVAGSPHTLRHFERSRPTFSSSFTPVKGSACGCEKSLFSSGAPPNSKACPTSQMISI